MNRTCLYLLIVCLTAIVAPAQVTLLTTFAGGVGQAGNMFDIQATNAVEICSFDLNLNTGTHDIEVYVVTGGGTYIGNETNPAAWTLIGQIQGLVSNGTGVPTPCPIAVNTVIPAGATQGFYVTVSSGGLMWYTSGTTQGAVFASDANITFFEGIANVYPFGGIFNPRVWNGNINYFVGSGCPAAPPSEFQTNQPESSLTLNGLPDPGAFQPINQASIVGTFESIDLASTNTGAPWDVGLLLPGSSMGFSVLGILTPGGQTVNLDLASPSLLFLNGGVSADLTTTAFPGPTFSVPFNSGAPIVAAGQMIVLDPILADGFALSHAANYSAETCNAAQNFDNLTTGVGNAPVTWTNPVGTSMPWTVQSGGTPSVGTGPTSASSGSNYMYCETSGVGIGATFEMDTCAIDLTQIAGVTGTLNFDLSRIGATIGTLNLLVDDGSGAGFVPITDPGTGLPVTYVGPDPSQAQGATEWSTEAVPFLHDITGSTVVIRFSYTGGTSFTADLAIDSFSVN